MIDAADREGIRGGHGVPTLLTQRHLRSPPRPPRSMRHGCSGAPPTLLKAARFLALARTPGGSPLVPSTVVHDLRHRCSDRRTGGLWLLPPCSALARQESSARVHCTRRPQKHRRPCAALPPSASARPPHRRRSPLAPSPAAASARSLAGGGIRPLRFISRPWRRSRVRREEGKGWDELVLLGPRVELCAIERRWL